MRTSFKMIPNIITFSRIILIIPLVLLLLEHEFIWAFGIFVFAGISDAVDGFLARRFAWQTDLGSYLDPAADKLLMLYMFSVLTVIKMLPLWFFVILFFRDFIIVCGIFYLQHRKGEVKMEPQLVSKLNTFLQIVLISCLLFDLAFYILPDYIIELLKWCLLTTTLLSLISYISAGVKLTKNGFKN